MSRSERYIAPSDSELQRLQQEHVRAEEFGRQRTELLRTALTIRADCRTRRKLSPLVVATAKGTQCHMSNAREA